MQITFTHNGNTIPIPADPPAEVKLYAVPVTYSADGYFAAVWMPRVLEPVPACAVENTELLAHLNISAQPEGGEVLVNAVFCKEGVTYAVD